MIRRNDTAIIRDILHVCWKEPTGKTAVVYRSNMNFNSATQYINRLIEMKVLEKVGAKYKITESGIALCNQLRALPVSIGGAT